MNEELSELLFNSLNEQGFLFQEACYNTLQRHDRDAGWEWKIKGYEYPVSINDQDTRVDIVLQSKISENRDIYALVECKRADPSFVYWLFGAAEGSPQDAVCSTLCIECSEYGVNRPYKPLRRIEQAQTGMSADRPISWLEAKKGSGRRSSSPQNIEDAFVQVLKGCEGFALEQLKQRGKFHDLFKTIFLPVVVTTAQLYVATYRLEDIDLATGKISRDKVNFGPKAKAAEEDMWVVVDYGVGESLAPEPIPTEYHGVDPLELQRHKARSIFVVNSKYLATFFSNLSFPRSISN